MKLVGCMAFFEKGNNKLTATQPENGPGFKV